MRKGYIVIGSLAACIILYVLEQIITVDYTTKTAVKVLLFTAAPYIYFKLAKKPHLMDGLNLVKLGKSNYRLVMFLGAASFTGVIGMYFLLGGYINFDTILQELRTKAQIYVSNYVFIGAYIILGNSFLEEFFFRGFVFLNLYKQGYKKLAYIYSSILFGVYHIAILNTWLSPLLLGLAVIGLTIVGVVFNWLDSRSGSITNSWIVHILADCAVIVIGLNMFDLI
ncbi:MAG TPA: CPBP family intramembrane glutamic endopeptidase [Clostridiaceae bacterium]